MGNTISYEVGLGRGDITAFHPGLGMMGYGHVGNEVERKETPLLCRAFCFREIKLDAVLWYAVCDMCFPTPAIVREVLRRIQATHPGLSLSTSNLVLTAQHTHSGPGGYSYHPLYNISVPGFVPEVFEDIIAGITSALLAAYADLQPAVLHYAEGAFPEQVPVAFNRSMAAYLRNPEVSDLGADDTHLAVDRTMRLLRIDRPDGTPRASINWFGVHTTSLHNDNTAICWDNKGYAAAMMEEWVASEYQTKSFSAAFAQGAAGDVTPNYIWDDRKKWTRGPEPDDIASAKAIGRLQFEQARDLFIEAKKNEDFGSGLKTAIQYSDLSRVTCAPDLVQGEENLQTTSSCHGIAFFKGTTEGPGMPPAIASVAAGLAQTVKNYELTKAILNSPEEKEAIRRKYRYQSPKTILFETGEGKVLGTRQIKSLILPASADKSIYYLKKLHPQTEPGGPPWIPQVLPLQLIQLGPLTWVNLPGEITVIAAERLRESVRRDLDLPVAAAVIIAPYSNAYCGYVTTPEEYELQAYEGGHTVYGKWTLPAFQTKYRQLASEMKRSETQHVEVREAEPYTFDQAEIAARSHAIFEVR